MGEWTEKAKLLRPMIEQAVQSAFTDDQAANAIDLFPNFNPNGHAYKKNDRFKWMGALYKVLQDHTSQEMWTPITASSLYTEVLTDPSGKPKVWVQPESTNPYMTGDRVLYPDANGSVYESTIDNNVWSPDTYPAGWRLVGKMLNVLFGKI